MHRRKVSSVNLLTSATSLLAPVARRFGFVRAEEAAPVEVRSSAPAGYTETQWLAMLSQMQRLGGIAGVEVTPLRVLGVATVFACVRVIAESVASLPCQVRVKKGGKTTVALGHPAHDLLSLAPNAEMTARDMFVAAVANQALRGNGYLELVRNRYGDIVEIWPTPAGQVQIGRNATRQLYYRINGKDIAAGDIVHARGLTFDGIVGADLPTTLRPVFELAIALQQHGVAYFANGGTPGVIFEFPTDPTPETKDEIRKNWNEKHVGPQNAHKAVVVGGGVKVTMPKVSQADAEFNDSRKAQDLQICQAFGVPPHKIGLGEGPAKGAEQASIEFTQSTLMPVITAWTQALNSRILTAAERAEGYRITFDLSGLMKGDMAARAAYFNTLISCGAILVDEAREMEGLDELPGGQGKIVRVPLNMVSADELNAIKASRQKTTTEPQPAA